MTDTTTDRTAGVQPKSRYHHGDLKQAMVLASYDLVSQHGAEDFKLCYVCKLTGVSTAAPYKHFRDRDEVLELVVTRGFEEMTRCLISAVEQAGAGTLAGIVAMGHAYLRFAIDEQHLFRLMFGQRPTLKQASLVEQDGMKCFANVIDQVALYCRHDAVAAKLT